jgi:uncharacterized protein with HEPN domain
MRRWLNDIHHHIILAQTFVGGMTYDTLRDDLRTTYAVTRCLEIISEASWPRGSCSRITYRLCLS